MDFASSQPEWRDLPKGDDSFEPEEPCHFQAPGTGVGVAALLGVEAMFDMLTRDLLTVDLLITA